MSKEIIINVTGEHSRIAIVEDGELVELYIENPENVRTIGDIFLGRVRRILPGIKAAFVDIGQKQDAFLHFSDLSDNLPDLLELSDGKVADHLKKHLAKAPKLPEDGESDLELETPQEQRAARRRRDLKRTHGRNRRGGRGRSKAGDKAAQNDEASADATAQQDAQASSASKDQKDGRQQESRQRSERRSDTRRQRDRQQDPEAQQPDASVSDGESQEAATDGKRERSGRGRQHGPAQPPVTDEVPDQAPSILPPESVDPPPSVEEAEAQNDDASDTQAAEAKPKRSRSGRGRGRGRGRGSRAQSGQSEDAQATQEQPEAQSGASSDASADAKADAKPKRSRGGRGRGTKQRGGSREESRGEAKQNERGAPAESESVDRQPEKSETKPAPKKAETKRETPAASSRFVIDLTSKPGRVERREEEEEEEEKKSSSRSRRGGRRRGGRNRGRGRSSSNGRSTVSKGDTAGEKDGDDKGKSSGRGRSGGRSGGRDSGSRSGGERSGPRPETYLKQDQKLIVKVTKEPISSKGPRVSTDVSLAGRFLVLIPQADYVAVSKKIESSKERRRLRALARSLLPEGFGLIVRTVAENRDAKALDTDLRLLLQKWHKIEDKLRKKPNPPAPLYEDVNMVSSIIRDLFSEDYDRIVVDDEKVFRNVKGYVQAVAPQMAPAVQLHKGKEHVFRKYKIDGEVRAAFESRVSLPGGGYLFIEHTEAMHVVDVNSGRAGRGLSQEQNSLRVNLESAKMIAKQLRLRDLGGIICVDFIDMRSESARKKVYDELKKEFRKDRAVTKLLPMSDFGVVQITRQRLRPSITTTTNVDDLPEAEPQQDTPAVEETPRTADTQRSARSGPQPTTAELVAHLERWLDTYRKEVQDQHRKRPILIKIHPLLAAYLDRGIPSTLTRWRFRTRLKLKLDVAEDADPLSFSVRDEKSGKNLTKKYDPDRRNA